MAQQNDDGGGCCGCLVLIGLYVLISQLAKSCEGQPAPPATVDTGPSSFGIWWDWLGGWWTLIFVIGYAVGFLTWAINEERGVFEGHLQDARALVAVPLVLGVWLISWLGGNLVSLLADVMTTLSNASPIQGDWNPIFVPWLVLLMMRIVLLPLQSNNARVDRKKGKVAPWFDGAEFTTRALRFGMLTFMLDALFLFLVVQAAQDPGTGWYEEDPDLLLPLQDNWIRFFSLILLVGLEVGLTALLFWAVQAIIAEQHDRGSTTWAEGPFLDERFDERNWVIDYRYYIAQTILLYLPALFILTLYQRENPFVFTVLFGFIGLKVVFTALAEFLSWWLDARNDRYLEELEEIVDDQGRPQTERAEARARLAELRAGLP